LNFRRMMDEQEAGSLKTAAPVTDTLEYLVRPQ